MLLKTKYKIFLLPQLRLQKLHTGSVVIFKQIKYYKKQGIEKEIQERYRKENHFLTNLISKNWNNIDKPKGLSTSELNEKIKNKEGVWYITLKKHSDKFFDRRVVKKNYYFYYSHS